MFVRNAWYAAAWSHELGDGQLARTILTEPVVLFRTSDGVAHALHDACPHRFAPLSMGKHKGDRIACAYHGLEFDGSGRCIHNPHGKGAIPASLSVRAYPVVERYDMVWVWPGDINQADPAQLPQIPRLEDDAFSWVHGRLHVEADYQLVIDNLLDLTHVEFMHPMLASEGNAARTKFRCEQEGDIVRAFYDVSDEPITGLFQILWENNRKSADLHAYMHWHAPSILYLDTGMVSNEEDGGPKIPTVHFLTPETAETTHYFWAAGRNRGHGNEQVSSMLQFATQNAFETEDEPMIRAVRSRMHSNDLFAHKPALLPMDEAGVRARRILEQRVTAEQS
ncbi:aromatic ring-hydroxylating dioxygenase subunit alpha [Novosphingobium profundi]|uniref:aromatic ring-hydroxylating dioxygenase subunit alpha n=1 Tax=Novosphingobium profundi TaxID=1774954 RepID=UPI001CFE1B97|nr:aromatic ring-hydroxylating dioxygenase subunit alpha [Novosphingobium profundi]